MTYMKLLDFVWD